MLDMIETFSAEVIAVFPNKVKIIVDDIAKFRLAEESLKVGSYLQISDNDNVALIAIIENFSIEIRENNISQRHYLIEAYPLGTLRDGKFQRGGDELAIPPKKVVPASKEDIKNIYSSAFPPDKQFNFCLLSQDREIKIPVHGNRFFNKHIAIVGATGSGKSHTVAHIIQNATKEKNNEYSGLNNSHIVIFDIHSEYASAFPDANMLRIDDLILPYWLLNEEEMEELFLESGDHNNYNQASLLRRIITINKQMMNNNVERIYFDSPLKYDIQKVINCFLNLSQETHNSDNPFNVIVNDESKTFADDEERLMYYSDKLHNFAPGKRKSNNSIGIKKGSYADGSIDKFIRRFQSKVRNSRLDFLFGERAFKATFNAVLKQLVGYENKKESNVTIIDLSGIPFEVLSITVSLITRLLFDYAYYYKRLHQNCETPLLLVYEEAHKYAPKSQRSRYRASLIAIERVAKEGRKYGISLLIASQRPSEISETIFSQCSNFLAMRLTNPDDQSYVKRLLPDTLGNLTSSLPAMECGEALLIGDAVVIPSVIYIPQCDPKPSSNDVPYMDIWKEEWKNVVFNPLIEEWEK